MLDSQGEFGLLLCHHIFSRDNAGETVEVKTLKSLFLEGQLFLMAGYLD